MRLNTLFGFMLFCVDSMQIDGRYYKIYLYPEQVVSHDDYWLAVNNKEYFKAPENFFPLFGETSAFNRSDFEGGTGPKLEIIQNRLKNKWENIRSKKGRRGVGARFVKQVRKYHGLFIGPKYEFNKEVIPPFEAIPDGKYVQLFTKFCLIDKKGEFKNGLKHGEWSMVKIDGPPRLLYRKNAKWFRKFGEFYDTDTLDKLGNYKSGILHGDYYQYQHQDKDKITGAVVEGEKSGTWKTYQGDQLTRSIILSNPKNERISHKPIIRTSSLFSGNGLAFHFYGYTYPLQELPVNFYRVGFDEEPDIELEEEEFKSHQLEYYVGYRYDNLPERFKKIKNFHHMYGFYDFHKDPGTDLVETRGYFIDSIGLKILYDGAYELFYPNGQLYTRYTFEKDELTDEGAIYWDNGIVHDEITFMPDSNQYIRRAYDYQGLLFETAIYDSLGDFVKTDRPIEVKPSLFIDGVTAKRKPLPTYGAQKFLQLFPGNYVYENWGFLKEEEFTDEAVTFYKRWNGTDSTVISELTYDPKTRKMVDYILSYTGKERWKSEEVFTPDYGSWTGKTNWKYGNYEVITKASGILKEKYDCAHTDHCEIRQLYMTWEANESLGRMNSFVQNFYNNGVLQNEGTVEDGLPQGLWKYYDPFGKLNLMGMFHQGKRNGRWLSEDLAEKKYLGEICLNPNLPDLEKEKKFRKNLLDITIINYHLGRALNKQFYDLNLNKYSNLKTN